MADMLSTIYLPKRLTRRDSHSNQARHRDPRVKAVKARGEAIHENVRRPSLRSGQALRPLDCVVARVRRRAAFFGARWLRAITRTVQLHRVVLSGHIGAAEGHVAVDPAASRLIQREALLTILQSLVRGAPNTS